MKEHLPRCKEVGAGAKPARPSLGTASPPEVHPGADHLPPWEKRTCGPMSTLGNKVLKVHTE